LNRDIQSGMITPSSDASDGFRQFGLKASGLSLNKNTKRGQNLMKLGRFAAIIIVLPVIFAALVGCGISQPIKVVPELPGSAQNNGTDHVIAEWDYPYNYRVTNYDLIIARGNDKGTIVQSYNISDSSAGQNSPLKATYEWNVPKDAAEGRYRAELQVKTLEAGGGVHDTISRAFDVARDRGNLRIFKYEDANGNGVYEKDEKGLSGWQFKITTPTSENYVRETDSNGFIVLKDLPIGSYIIEEVERPGYKPTTENRQSAQVLKDATKDVTFGNKPLPASIKVIKYEDKNQNKVQDPDETGVPGWEFSIQGPSSFKVTTTSNGSISQEVAPGNYRVTEVLKSPDDWRATTSTEQSINLELGQEGVLKFGNFRIPRSTLTIIKFEDLNGNGVYDQNQGEKGLADWEFSVEGKEPFNDKTGSDGIVSHKDIRPDTYTIREIAKPGWFSTTRTEQSVTINPGEEKKVYFGNKRPQPITKFEDRNGNGVMDAGEQGLSGWTFEIKGPVTTSRTTDANGQININDLPAGSYLVTESLTNPIWYNTTPMSVSMTVPGQDVRFGNDKYRTLKVFKFNDLNRNGKYEQNESGLNGWEFQVSGGVGQNITNSNGIATFKVKANKKYNVSESLPVGWLNSTPLDIEVQIDPTKDTTEIRFGDYAEIIEPSTEKDTRISILAFNDTNRNGVMDSIDPGLPNREIRISDINDTTNSYGSVFTDANGSVEYICPAPGTYLVWQMLPDGWCSNGAVAEEVTVLKGETKSVSFGSYPCIDGNCEYRFTPQGSNRTLWVEDENLMVEKSVDPYVLSLPNHDMVKGALINYTITVCAKPKIGPTDLILAVDTSGSVIEGNKAALTQISRGINEFVEEMKKSQNPNFRIGLVSWDRDIDETVKPTVNYNEIINASGRLRANSQELTMYHVGMNGSLDAFNAAPRADARKVIVFITDARNEYEPFQGDLDPTKYTIYVLLMGQTQVNETYDMLNDTANRFNGKLLRVDSSAQIASALNSLSKTSLMASGTINDIKIEDTLPAYLRPLNNGTIPGQSQKNQDGINWRTNTLTWSIPSLQYGKCWSTTFTTVFCWKLQANVVQPADSPRVTSQVNYADPTKAARKTVLLPEGTIWIESGSPTSSETKGTSGSTEPKQQPSVGMAASLIGLLSVAYLLRRK
jgi:hypothetical protein